MSDGKTTGIDETDWKNTVECGNLNVGTFKGKTMADACQANVGCCVDKLVKKSWWNPIY